MNTIAKSLIVVIVLTVGHSALASDWTSTFGVEAVRTYLPAPGIGVMVVAAGSNVADAKEAAGALQFALQQTGSVNPVMSDEALGDASALEDQAIVHKAGPFPVHLIAVVRVFDAAPGLPRNVVAVFYDKTANVITAINAQEGVALAVNTQSAQQPGQGVTSQAASTVSDITQRGQVDVEAAIAQYEDRMIWFQNWVGVNAGTGAVMATWSVPYQGKYKKPLRRWRFYRLVGRRDLVKKYKKRMGIKGGLLGGGGVMFIGGMGMMMYGLLSETGECVDRYDDGECLTRVNKPILGAGVAIGVVGLVGAMIGMFMKVHPVNESERLQLADEYNGRLRQELGLTDEIISKYRRLTAFADVGFAPLALPDGGALGLSGRFNFQLD